MISQFNNIQDSNIYNFNDFKGSFFKLNRDLAAYKKLPNFVKAIVEEVGIC